MSRKNADRSRAQAAARNLTYEDRRLGIGVRQRDPETLTSDILALLAASSAPLMKWQIRETLHEPEDYIMRRLQALRKLGQVKVVGKNLDRRAWALASWRPSAVEAEDMRQALEAKRRPAPGMPAKVPLRSWWLVPASEFSQAAKAETRRMELDPQR